MREWNPPESVRAAGERATRLPSFLSGPPVLTGEPSQLEPCPAVEELRAYLRARWPRIASVGLRRSPAKPADLGRVRDPHEGGYAADVMIGSDLALGSEVANWLVVHGEELGLQYVLFARREWSRSRWGAVWERYSGSNPHEDHVHVEVNAAAYRWPRGVMAARLAAIDARARYGWVNGALEALGCAALAVWASGRSSPWRG